jgi:integrase
MEPQRPQKTKFKTEHGTVIIYTPRHVGDCQLQDRNQNLCNCPKWAYAKPRAGRAVQCALKTPSFAEAIAKAQELLDSFNPKVAAALAITQPKAGITIEDALALYEAMKRRTVTPKYVIGCLQPFKRRKQKEYRHRKEHGRARNLSLLDWLDRENRTARAPVVRLAQLTSDHLDQWCAGWETNDASSHLWRGKVAQFLKWARLHEHIEREPVFREPLRVRSGNRCGHFSDDQIAKMYQGIPFYRMPNGHPLPDNFAARMTAFIDLGRYGGMAITDIVFFQPKVSLGKNNVLVYRRRKNNQVASVLLPAKIAARLRSIPPETGSDPERPFRFSTDPEVNCETWRYRFQAICRSVGITEIETEIGKKRAPNVHMLRDSLAIGAIVSGVGIDNVSRMLGHRSTQTTQKSYLFWIAKRDDFCIEDQRKALERAAAAQEAEPEPDVPPTLVN